MGPLLPRSLQGLLLLSESVLLALVVIAGGLGAAGTLLWRDSSEEALRMNGQLQQAERIRGDLYRQIGEATRARLMEDVEALANTVADNGGVYLVPAFAGLGAPHWDSYARGTLQGITRGTTAGHIARAALEGIAFQVADLVGAMDDDAGRAMTELRVDGGAAANDTLMQMQADFLQIPVVRPTVTETTALGAAYLAGLATGVWKDGSAIEGNWQVDRRFEPAVPATRIEELRARWREAVQRSKGWAGKS